MYQVRRRGDRGKAEGGPAKGRLLTASMGPLNDYLQWLGGPYNGPPLAIQHTADDSHDVDRPNQLIPLVVVHVPICTWNGRQDIKEQWKSSTPGVAGQINELGTPEPNQQRSQCCVQARVGHYACGLPFRSQLHHIFSKVWDTKISCFAEVGACGGLPQPRGLYKPSACLLRRGSTSPWGHVPTRAPQSPSIVLVGYPGRVFRALEKGERSRDE
jgi:hypothetical protein